MTYYIELKYLKEYSKKYVSIQKIAVKKLKLVSAIFINFSFSPK